jgi:hypothetical protein
MDQSYHEDFSLQRFSRSTIKRDKLSQLPANPQRVILCPRDFRLDLSIVAANRLQLQCVLVNCHDETSMDHV